MMGGDGENNPTAKKADILASKQVAKVGNSSHFQIREGEADNEKLARRDAMIIHDIVRKALPNAGLYDLSDVHVFERWLKAGVLYRIVEKRRNSEFTDAVGYYSIHSLKLDAFEKMSDNKLHHDELGDEHFVHLSESDPTSNQNEKNPQVCLFILDVETVLIGSGTPSRQVASILLTDLAEQVRRLLSANNVRFIAGLGSSKEGAYWLKSFGLKENGTCYHPGKHQNWRIYSTDAGAIRHKFEALGARCWPLFDKNYPYSLNYGLLKKATVEFSKVFKNRVSHTNELMS